MNIGEMMFDRTEISYEEHVYQKQEGLRDSIEEFFSCRVTKTRRSNNIEYERESFSFILYKITSNEYYPEYWTMTVI